MFRSNQQRRELAIGVALAIGIGLVAYFHLVDHFDLAYIKEHLDFYRSHAEERWAQVLPLFFGIFVLSTASTIPPGGMTILSLLAGAIFGLGWGTVIASFASTIGATLAFLISRFLFRKVLQRRISRALRTINEGLDQDGVFYLFSLRLIPLFPFFLVNIAMGLTPMSARTFFAVSQLGMLLNTFAYVNAGVELASVNTISDIMSWRVLLSLCALGVLPLISRAFVASWRTNKAYHGFRLPKRYDYNLLVIGGGSAGLEAAAHAASFEAQIGLIERDRMGGDCLHTGCVPSKALLRAAHLVHMMRNSSQFGVKVPAIEFDFSTVMERVRQVVSEIEPQEAVERYAKLGVDCVKGRANLISPWEVEVDGHVLTAKNIIIATGTEPLVPPIRGLETMPYLTSETVWDVWEVPKRLLIVGGGPLGCEMAQCYARFGAEVTIVEMYSRILQGEDPDVSKFMTMRLQAEGIRICVGHKAVEFLTHEGEKRLLAEYRSEIVPIDFDTVLLAMGRVARTSGFGLRKVGVNLRSDGTIDVNDFLQTNIPNIYACGDVTGPYQFRHVAAHQARYAAFNALFRPFKQTVVDHSAIPWCTYTDPEVATVGYTETRANEEGVPYDATKYGFDELDRAIIDGRAHGFVKVLTAPGCDRIIGATIVGAHASDALVEFVAAINQGFGLQAIRSAIHVYPSMGAGNASVANNWHKATRPRLLRKLLHRYQTFMRH